MEKDDQEQGKHIPITNPFAHTEKVDYDHDHALALALQQQEEAEFTMLETTESDETEDDDDEEGDESYLSSTDSDDGNFFTSQELAEMQLLDEEEEEELLEEESNMEEEEVEEEDEIDPDELSYEDLVALGEIVGQENQGLSPEEIITILTPHIYKPIHSNIGIDRCVICQVEYEEGENLVALRCEHLFHGYCINQWLQIKKICPICSKEANKQKTE